MATRWEWAPQPRLGTRTQDRSCLTAAKCSITAAALASMRGRSSRSIRTLSAKQIGHMSASMNYDPHARYRYIVQATERAFELAGDAERRPAEELAEAAAQAHEALKMLLEDQQFVNDLDRWTTGGTNQVSLAEQAALVDELRAL